MLPAELPERRLHVLLAEDNVVNQRLAASLLERRGHKVTIAANGREALAAVTAQPFDVVLMDVQMPEMGGFEATAAIRALETERQAPRMPIIAMTAHAMKGDRERCLAAGMDEYLTKPLDPRQLCALVEQMAGGAPAGDRAASWPPSRWRCWRASAATASCSPRSAGCSSTMRRGTFRRSARRSTRATANRCAAPRTGSRAPPPTSTPTAWCSAARTLEEIGRTGEFEAHEAAWQALTSRPIS